jgi:hypothetical protein
VGLPNYSVPSDQASRAHPLDVDRIANAISVVALLGCAAAWLVPIHLPLWLDETISTWQISAGFHQLWQRQEVVFVAYPFLLWLMKSLFGASVVALRIPSVLASLASLVVMFRIAREFFDRSVSLLTTVVFACYPPVVFAAIDARPYAFATLAVCLAILMFLRWERTYQPKFALLFGIACALIFYFHFLFGIVLISFGVLWILGNNKRTGQLALALAAFAVMMIPVIPRLVYIVQSRQTHSYESAPFLLYLGEAFAPRITSFIFLLVAFLAVVLNRCSAPTGDDRRSTIYAVSLGVMPILLLFVVSVSTPLHIFVTRYRLVAIPGIALCWGLIFTHVQSQLLRTLFCVGLLLALAQQQVGSPVHNHSWKKAINIANENTAVDHAPVVMCSDIIESDYRPMPAKPADSLLFAPLSYYPIHSRVVPLPKSLSPMAKSEAEQFLREAVPAHQRFVGMAHAGSVEILNWIQEQTKSTYTTKDLGFPDDVKVMEFDPK